MKPQLAIPVKVISKSSSFLLGQDEHLYRLLGEAIDEGKQLSVVPIIQLMCEREYKDAATIRDLFGALPLGKQSAEFRAFMQNNLSQLQRDQFSLSGQPDKRTDKQIQTLMHMLFLEVYRLSAGVFDPAIIESISDLPNVSQEDRSIFTDMHLYF